MTAKEFEALLYRWRFWIAGIFFIALGFWLEFLPSNAEEAADLIRAIGNLVKR